MYTHITQFNSFIYDIIKFKKNSKTKHYPISRESNHFIKFCVQLLNTDCIHLAKVLEKDIFIFFFFMQFVFNNWTNNQKKV